MKRDFKDAFGQADPSFVDAVHRTLTQIKRNEEEPIMKRKLRVSMAFAIVGCMLVAAVAFAAVARLGVLDFIVGRYSGDIQVLPEATAIIEQDIAQTGGHTEHADFTVREAVCDGQYAYIAVAITPKDDKTLLLGTDSDPSNPVSDFGPRFAEQSKSIADYAKEIGAEKLVQTSVGLLPDSDIDIFSLDYMLEEDGTLVYMLMGESLTDQQEAPVELKCATTDILVTKDTVQPKSETVLSFTLKVADAIGTVTSVAPVEFADCGVRVDSVQLTATPMAVYTEVAFTVTDKEKYAPLDDGLWFEFLDDAGNAFPDGATAGGSISPLDESQTQFIQKSSLNAMQTLPTHITLRGYNSWEKNRYSVQEITLQ